MSIIQKPIITEKSLVFASKGWYTFAVNADARKEQIILALKEAYNVDAIQVRTIRMPQKKRRVGKKMITITKTEWKKAIIQLKAGQKLDLYEVSPEPEQEK